MNIVKIFEKHKVYRIDQDDFSCIEDFLTLPNIKSVAEPKIAVFFKDTNENLLNEKLHQFLANILKAVNIDIENVLLVNVSKPINAAKVCSTFNLNKAILFGIHLDEVSMQIQINNYQSINLNKISYLFAESLDEIESDKAKKVELWNALKLFFEIK
jgi:hypothetical protein